MKEMKNFILGLGMGIGIFVLSGFNDEGREGRYQLEAGKVLIYSPDTGRETAKEYLFKIDTKTGNVYKHVEVKSGRESSDRWIDVTGLALRKK